MGNELKNKIEVLKVIRRNLEVMISILEGKFYKSQLLGNGTIREQIDCYDTEGEVLTDLYDSIIDEHGDELCPFDQNRPRL